MASSFQYDGHDLEALADMPRYYNWIMRTFAPYLKGRTLEIGAGIGNFASYYVDHVDEAVLLEPAPNLYPALTERFADRQQVRPYWGCLNRYDQRLNGRSGSFDSTVMINVLEHIEDDRQTLQTIHRLLRVQGTLLIYVPALRWLYGTLDASLQHYRRYTRSHLTRLLQRSGFQIQEMRYFDVLGVVPWLLMGRILKRQSLNRWAACVYDRIGVPVTSLAERWAEPRFGKNLICVAVKPGKAIPASQPPLKVAA